MLDPQLFSSGCSPDPKRFTSPSAYIRAVQECEEADQERKKRERLWHRWITALVLTMLTLLLLLALAFILPPMPMFFVVVSSLAVVCFIGYSIRAYAGGAFR